MIIGNFNFKPKEVIKMGGRMNWDRVRREEQMRRNGSEYVWQDNAFENSIYEKATTPLRTQREKGYVSFQAFNSSSSQRKPTENFVKCPICSTRVKVKNMQGHIRKAHATNEDLLKLLKTIQLSVNIEQKRLLDLAIIIYQEVTKKSIHQEKQIVEAN
jgi:uncharacterized C2H2 Zn-finger protein